MVAAFLVRSFLVCGHLDQYPSVWPQSWRYPSADQYVFHAAEKFSRIGLTRVLYAATVWSCLAQMRFLFTYPRLWLALLVILWTCGDQDISLQY